MNRAPDQSSFLRSRRSKALYQFKQQKLPACKPVLTPTSVIRVFLIMGFVFIPTGFITLRASRDAIEIIDRYDVDCIPEEYKANKLSYITNSSIPKNCTRYLKEGQRFERIEVTKDQALEMSLRLKPSMTCLLRTRQ